MKTIQLQDEESWYIENTGVVKYVISENSYEKLELIMFCSSYTSDFHVIEGAELNAPNLNTIIIDATSESNTPFFEGIKFKTPKLKTIYLTGIGSVKCFQDIHQNTDNLMLEELGCDSTGITQIPEFILRMKSLESLMFRHEEISELPEDLFTLENLKRFEFPHGTEIKIIPDDIKKLVNLEHFLLWRAKLQYLSPELFLLPKLKYVDFIYTQYSPTKELLDAYEIFKGRNKDYHSTMPWE